MSGRWRVALIRRACSWIGCLSETRRTILRYAIKSVVMLTAVVSGAIGAPVAAQGMQPAEVQYESMTAAPGPTIYAASIAPSLQDIPEPDGDAMHPAFRDPDSDDSHLPLAVDSAASHRGRRLAIGMAAGVVGGAALGYTIARAACPEDRPNFCELGYGIAAIGGAFIGLIVGGIIGAHADKPASDDDRGHASLRAIPLDPHSFAVTVAVR